MRDAAGPDPAEEFHTLLLAMFPELDQIRAPLSLVLHAISDLSHDSKKRLLGWELSAGDVERGQTYQARWPLALRR
jgi:hypothetical protein